ncbi:hypothetical protein DM02DRAFT_619108 [Periconia macrospinosa]|uniref:Conserved oligomeric Golgi complex subunit 2 n=1 Tax=Periconia macrospinosa TaxID=97972 RepID=A0A2V1D6P6_9PLEO|nr:hypothetical protein DM02DRAFT_619108 [Periconia macrospinosa]
MSGFYIGDSSPSHPPSTIANDNSDASSTTSSLDLPYPEPLPRSAFLAPDFTPTSYLSTLHNRHQTLEDLRSELRARSQLLSRELLDLVNGNYQDFLGLGRSLKGGDEKVEEVRVGLLGLRKEVEACRDVVGERESEVVRLLGEKVGIRREIVVGRRLVEFDARLRALEEELLVEAVGGKAGLANGGGGGDESEVEDEDSEEDEDEEDSEEEEGGTFGVSIAKLRRHSLQYRVVQRLEKGLADHPFVTAQAPRMIKVRNTLLLDLSSALQQAKSAGVSGQGRIVKIMNIYADMDESAEAVKVLKSLKT